MKKLLRIALLVFMSSMGYSQTIHMKTITKDGMTLEYKYEQEFLSFEVSAPTSGWITIGFNEQQDLKGSLLIMCRVIDGKAEIVEHHTIGVGNYKPVVEMGGNNAVTIIDSKRRKGITSISFSTPIAPVDQYHKDLSQGNELYITLAYSQSTDFQHHSIMRTNIKSIL